MSGKKSRNKGKQGERELVKELNKYGFNVRRTAQFCGKTGQAGDIEGLPSIHIECKRYKEGLKKLYEWLEQSQNDSKATDKGDIPTVMFRTDNNPWVVALNLNDFITIYKEFESGLFIK